MIIVKKYIYLFFAALIGVVVFLYFFEIEILNPKNITWLTEGDRLQNYLGSYAFRADDWHFPLLKTTLIAYPEGVSIIYTDSNPLFSLLFKLLRPIFSAEDQFFGIWLLFCWTLQGTLSYLVVKRLTANNLYALISALLLCILPAMFHRIMHVNLVAFWVILWAIYVYLIDDDKHKLKEGLFVLVFLIGVLIHGYFFIMSLLIASVWYIKRCIFFLKKKEYKKLALYVLRLLGYSFFFFLCLWCLGFFYNAPIHNGSMGFGTYSMNLLSPFDPQKRVFSSLLPNLPHNKWQSVEGYQYLGLGVILLYMVVAFLMLVKLWNNVKKSLIYGMSGLFIVGFIIMTIYFPIYHAAILLASVLFLILILDDYFKTRNVLIWLFIPAILSLVFALSHKVFLGEVRVLKYSIIESGFGSKLFQMIRSSGRFFWVTNFVLLLVSISFLYGYIKKYSIVVIGLCITVQFVDLSNIKEYTIQPKREISEVNAQVSQMVKAARRVDFIGVKDLKLALLSIQNNTPINSFHMVHGDGERTTKKLLLEMEGYESGEKEFNDSTVYFLKKEKLWDFNNYRELNFYNYNKDIYLATTLNFPYKTHLPVIVFSGKTLTSILSSIKQKQLVAIAVKDEAANKMPSFFANFLDSLHGTHISNLKIRESYIAIFKEGVLVHEVSSSDALTFSQNINGKQVEAISVGGVDGDNIQASIKINKEEYSLNLRGLNIVSVDSLGRFSSFNFDTYAVDYKE